MKYGYARVSTSDQDLTIQETALQKAGCDIIRGEKVSGTSREGRQELDTLLQFLRAGDSLVVTRIDRLARSISDLQDIGNRPLWAALIMRPACAVYSRVSSSMATVRGAG
ncbi:recombinase family protein, partial [Acetobacter pomorum]|uniref:recombinase family protein n=1 Tax=Acetobacter pomorum TaxID=65959 RepID=UPI001EE8FB4F